MIPECKYNTKIKYNTCSCTTFYDSASLCKQTVFDAYNDMDLFYPSIGIVIYVAFLFFYVSEFVLDVQRICDPLYLDETSCLSSLDCIFEGKNSSLCKRLYNSKYHWNDRFLGFKYLSLG